jgi:hypothetical protein
VEFGGGKIKRGVGGGEFPFVIGGEDADPLGEAALARGPAGVYAKFENTEWDDGGGEDVDDADKAVGTIDFETDVFADKSGLEIGNHGESVEMGGLQFPHRGEGSLVFRSFGCGQGEGTILEQKGSGGTGEEWEKSVDDENAQKNRKFRNGYSSDEHEEQKVGGMEAGKVNPTDRHREGEGDELQEEEEIIRPVQTAQSIRLRVELVSRAFMAQGLFPNRS